VAELRDIRVHAVSLVDKAAVRDPLDPSKPRRFLLYKSEGYVERAEAPDEEQPVEDEVKPPLKVSSVAEQLAYLEKVSPSAAAAYKRQHPNIIQKEDRMATTTISDGELDVSSGAQAGIQRARDVLAPYADEPRVAALLSKLNAVGDPVEAGEDEDGDDAEGRLTKCLTGLRSTLSKADIAGPTRDALRKSQYEIERELLAVHNPRAANEWDRTYGKIHAVA
jgi:hypothetical protein